MDKVEYDNWLDAFTNVMFAGKIPGIESHLKPLKDFSSSKHPEVDPCSAHYHVGSLHYRICTLLEGDASWWRTNMHPDEQFPKNLSAAINHLRRAKALLSAQSEPIRNQLITNLACALDRQRRDIEVLNDYICDFKINSEVPYVASLNKGNTLIDIGATALIDPNLRNAYLYEAFCLLKNLKSHFENSGDHGKKNNYYQRFYNKINRSNIVLLLSNEKRLETVANWQTKYEQRHYSPEEARYRRWCLDERLFVNPLNDITTEWIADEDKLSLPNLPGKSIHGRNIAAPFSALMREFCFARYLAYEAIHQIHPNFEANKLFLEDTLDGVDYSGSTEKKKSAFRICFSCLDSLASVMNTYFDCNSSKITFSPGWIKENFQDKAQNRYIDALYWLSCDLFDNEKVTMDSSKWKAPNPESAIIREIRNAMEHGWLRVAKHPYKGDKSDNMCSISSQELQTYTLSLLKLVRAAILYFAYSVKTHEDQKSVTME